MFAPSQLDNKPVQATQFDKIFQLNDRNERAFSYYNHCLKHSEPMNDQFMSNFKLTANLLFDEAVETLGWTEKLAMEQILKRRDMIQQKLASYYNAEGCYSTEAQAAQKHYTSLSAARAEDIENYFSDKS